MPSRRFRWSASVRGDQRDRPDSTGDDILVKAINRAPTLDGTLDTRPATALLLQTGKLGDVLAPPPSPDHSNDPCTKRHTGRNISRPGQLPQVCHLFSGEIPIELNEPTSLRFYERDHETLARERFK